jgi:hypothetical protein
MSKSQLLLKSINNFYSDEAHRTTLLNILTKKSGISLRNIEWFICNYAKKHHTSFTTTEGKVVPVHCLYKSSLNGYSKTLFDPFARAEKFDYQVPGTGETLHTTIAQLNFIKWCISTKIIDYIEANRLTLFKKAEV